MTSELSAEQQHCRDVARRSYDVRHPERSLDADMTIPMMFAAYGEATDWHARVLRQGQKRLRKKNELEAFPELPVWVIAGVVALAAFVNSARSDSRYAALAEAYKGFDIDETLEAMMPGMNHLRQEALRAAHEFDRAVRKRVVLGTETLRKIVAPYRAAWGDLAPSSDFTLLGEALWERAVFMSTRLAKGPPNRSATRSITAFVRAVQQLYREEKLGKPGIDDFVDIWMYMTATGPRAVVYKWLNDLLSKRRVYEPRRTGRGARKPRSPNHLPR